MRKREMRQVCEIPDIMYVKFLNNSRFSNLKQSVAKPKKIKSLTPKIVPVNPIYLPTLFGKFDKK